MRIIGFGIDVGLSHWIAKECLGARAPLLRQQMQLLQWAVLFLRVQL